MISIEQQIGQIRQEIRLEKLLIKETIKKGKIFDEVKEMTQRLKELHGKLDALSDMQKNGSWH